MFTCKPLCFLGIVMTMWGLTWAIFLPKFIWMMVAGMAIGWMFSKDC